MSSNLKELPENPTATEFDEIRKCFHIVLKTTKCPLIILHNYAQCLIELVISCFNDLHCSCVSKNCNLKSLGRGSKPLPSCRHSPTGQAATA